MSLSKNKFGIRKIASIFKACCSISVKLSAGYAEKEFFPFSLKVESRVSKLIHGQTLADRTSPGPSFQL